MAGKTPLVFYPNLKPQSHNKDSKISKARSYTPGWLPPRQPATFIVWTLLTFSHSLNSSFSEVWTPEAMKQGFWSLLQSSCVSWVPWSISLSFTMTRVPSDERIFLRVLTWYSADEVSFKGYFSGIFPSSLLLPLGHQPPQGIPFASAKSNAARSTPVCPPEIIADISGAGLAFNAFDVFGDQ